MLQKINSLLNHKISTIIKLEAFADNKQNIAKMTISLFNRVEEILIIRENAGNSLKLFIIH